MCSSISWHIIDMLLVALAQLRCSVKVIPKYLVRVITWSRGRWLIYHIRAQSARGLSAKRPRAMWFKRTRVRSPSNRVIERTTISELAKPSAKNDYSCPAKSSRFDFTLTNDDFEDLQAVISTKDNHLQYKENRKGDSLVRLSELHKLSLVITEIEFSTIYGYNMAPRALRAAPLWSLIYQTFQ